MSDFKKHLERSLQDKEFAWEWEEQSAERDVARKVVEAQNGEENRLEEAKKVLRHQRKRDVHL